MIFQEDEEFELITKSELKKLKEELRKLKEEKEKKKASETAPINKSPKIEEEIKEIKKEITRTRELCKKILDVSIETSLNKINEMVDSLKEMTKLIKLMIEILETRNQNNIPEEIFKRLEKIEKFMNQISSVLSGDKP